VLASGTVAGGGLWGVMLLRCEECGKAARTGEEARGWRTFLTVVEEGKPAEAVDYCPDCAKREFETGR
jgi:hypothetical protein